MEQQIEMMRRILELSGTCIEGLDYLHTRLHKGYLEDSYYLIEDIVHGFCQIRLSMKVLNMETEEITDTTQRAEGVLSDFIYACEHQGINEVILRLSHELSPAFSMWNQELNLNFNHHILS